MNKLLTAVAFVAFALPVAASAETITTGVSNSVGSSVFCGTFNSNTNSVYNANGVTVQDTYANKTVKSGFDAAGVGTPSTVVTTTTPAVDKGKGDDKAGKSDNNHDDKSAGTTSTTTNPGAGASVGLNGITENSGSSSHTVLSFGQTDTAHSDTSGHLVQFSANSSVSSFVQTGI